MGLDGEKGKRMKDEECGYSGPRAWELTRTWALLGVPAVIDVVHAGLWKVVREKTKDNQEREGESGFCECWIGRY